MKRIYKHIDGCFGNDDDLFVATEDPRDQLYEEDIYNNANNIYINAVAVLYNYIGGHANIALTGYVVAEMTITHLLQTKP